MEVLNLLVEEPTELNFLKKLINQQFRNAISDRCVNDNGNNIAPEVKTVDNAYTLK